MYKNLLRVLVSLSLSSVAITAEASHHFESKLAVDHPEYDLTDLYVFDAERKNYTAFIMTINPQTKADNPVQFGKNGIYSFHISTSNNIEDNKGLTIVAHTMDNKVSFSIIDEANPAVGAKGTSLGTVTAGTTDEIAKGIKVWTGIAKDPFVGNGEGLTVFLKDLDAGKLNLSAYDNASNAFQNANSTAIVIEVPNNLLGKKIHTYATSAMYNVDKWEQVNRLANPLVTHLHMYNNTMEITEHVAHRPDIDMKQRYSISSNILRAVTLDNKISDKVGYADQAAKSLMPDMIPYTVGTPAAYVFGNINGRKTTDDAMDTALSIFVGRKVTDQANTFNHHPTKFPYLETTK